MQVRAHLHATASCPRRQLYYTMSSSCPQDGRILKYVVGSVIAGCATACLGYRRIRKIWRLTEQCGACVGLTTCHALFNFPEIRLSAGASLCWEAPRLRSEYGGRDRFYGNRNCQQGGNTGTPAKAGQNPAARRPAYRETSHRNAAEDEETVGFVIMEYTSGGNGGPNP